MKEIIETTTGFLANHMILTECGECAGDYQREALDFINKYNDEKIELINHHWVDVMFDQYHKVYAIYAEDALTCYDAKVLYIELEKKDCSSAFEDMQRKFTE